MRCGGFEEKRKKRGVVREEQEKDREMMKVFGKINPETMRKERRRKGERLITEDKSGKRKITREEKEKGY